MDGTEHPPDHGHAGQQAGHGPGEGLPWGPLVGILIVVGLFFYSLFSIIQSG